MCCSDRYESFASGVYKQIGAAEAGVLDIPLESERGGLEVTMIGGRVVPVGGYDASNAHSVPWIGSGSSGALSVASMPLGGRANVSVVVVYNVNIDV